MVELFTEMVELITEMVELFTEMVEATPRCDSCRWADASKEKVEAPLQRDIDRCGSSAPQEMVKAPNMATLIWQP
eukprot:3392780-Prymnesium_polylepis.3